MSDEAKPKPLTNKQKVFVAEYLKTWNASEAARRAGYSEKTARSIGQENLTKPDIRAEIEARLAEVHMGADEALKLTADIARGDMGEYLDISSVGFNIDLLNEDGTRKNTRLIKKIKQKVTTFIAKKESDEDREIVETEFELYDAQAAQRDVLKMAGKFVDKLDLSNKDGTLKIVIEYADDKGKTSEAA